MKVKVELPLFKGENPLEKIENKKKFVDHLLAAARAMVPNKEWNQNELLDILLDIASKSEKEIEIHKGRRFRTHLRKLLDIAEKYKDPFSIVIIKLRNKEYYDRVLDILSEKLRSSDEIFLYKDRLVGLLPSTSEKVVEPLLDRIEFLMNELLDMTTESYSIEIATFPSKLYRSKTEFVEWINNNLQQ